MGVGMGEVASLAATGAALAEGVRAGAFSAENTITAVPTGWALTNGAFRIKDPNPTTWRTSLLAPEPT